MVYCNALAVTCCQCIVLSDESSSSACCQTRFKLIDEERQDLLLLSLYALRVENCKERVLIEDLKLLVKLSICSSWHISLVLLGCVPPDALEVWEDLLVLLESHPGEWFINPISDFLALLKALCKFNLNCVHNVNVPA